MVHCVYVFVIYVHFRLLRKTFEMWRHCQQVSSTKKINIFQSRFSAQWNMLWQFQSRFQSRFQTRFQSRFSAQWNTPFSQSILLVFDVCMQQTLQNAMQTKKSTFCTLASVQFRIGLQNQRILRVSWSAYRGPSVAQPVRIFSKTTAAVFCTIVGHKVVRCLNTLVIGW